LDEEIIIRGLGFSEYEAIALILLANTPPKYYTIEGLKRLRLRSSAE